MENFVVSARKYRPSVFSTVLGQSHITTTLKNAIKTKQLAQAFLFCGPRGVGKTTCARILAKTINCENLTAEIESCGQCSSCTNFKNNQSLNIHELDAASHNSVEDIRSLVDQVRYPPQVGKYKIYIIDEVHMLSNAAFNAFLKTLEEPPPYAIFILATTEKHKIIPTILSRCQIFDFNRIQIEDIVHHLLDISTKENINAEKDALHLIAQKADGGLRDALSMYDLLVTFSTDNSITLKDTLAHLNILDYDYYFKITDVLYAEDRASALLLFNEIIRKGFDGRHFINGLGEHFRNLLVSKDQNTHQLLQVSENIQNKYYDQAQSIGASFLLSSINIINLCDVHYRESKNQRLHVELALMKISHLNAAFALKDVKTDTPELKKKDKVKSVDTSANPTQEKSLSGKIKKTTNLPLEEHLTSIEKQKNTENTPPLLAPKTLRKEEFSEEDMFKAWETLKEKNENQAAYILLNREPELREKLITILLDNSTQLIDFQKLKIEWLGFLKEILQNDEIELEAKVSSSPKTKKLYTDSDKFNALIKNNPILADLQQQLGLDLDV